MTRAEMEAALDAGKLQCLGKGKVWFTVIRKGATKTRPLTDKDWFNVPCQYGSQKFASIVAVDLTNGRLRIVP